MLIELARTLPPWTFVAGKGGVGKTTVAASLAIALADSGEPTLVLSTDPAHSLGDALGQGLHGDPVRVTGVPNLNALEVDPDRERESFLGRYGTALRALLDQVTFLGSAEIDELLELPVSGIDELGALWRLAGLSAARHRVVVDTAPTGHTLRMLAGVSLAEAWLDALADLHTRHAVIGERLARAPVPDEARGMLDTLREELRDLSERLHDPRRVAFVLVTQADPVVEAETRRLRAELESDGITVAGTVVNRAGPAVAGRMESTRGRALYLPHVRPGPTGVAALRALARRVQALPPHGVGAPTAPGQLPGRGAPYLPPSGRGLYLVAGKGGVGKTTAASALALLIAREHAAEVLLLSADPAGSLAEVWGVPVGGGPVSVKGEPRLRLRQLDAGGAWDQLRDSIRHRLAERGAGASSSSAGPAGDMLERFIELTPPGVDELVGLIEVVESLDSGEVDAVVLDTAPTGHLMRLLDAPDLILEWTHAIMRVLLRNRDVIGLSGLGEEVLSLAKRTRRIRDRLRDARRRFVVVVALPEAIGVAEAERLIASLRRRDVGPDLLLVNRATAAEALPEAAPAQALRSLVELAGATPIAAAPDLPVGPTGADALLGFAREWHLLEGAYT